MTAACLDHKDAIPFLILFLVFFAACEKDQRGNLVGTEIVPSSAKITSTSDSEECRLALAHCQQACDSNHPVGDCFAEGIGDAERTACIQRSADCYDACAAERSSCDESGSSTETSTTETTEESSSTEEEPDLGTPVIVQSPEDEADESSSEDEEEDKEEEDKEEEEEDKDATVVEAALEVDYDDPDEETLVTARSHDNNDEADGNDATVYSLSFEHSPSVLVSNDSGEYQYVTLTVVEASGQPLSATITGKVAVSRYRSTTIPIPASDVPEIEFTIAQGRSRSNRLRIGFILPTFDATRGYLPFTIEDITVAGDKELHITNQHSAYNDAYEAPTQGFYYSNPCQLICSDEVVTGYVNSCNGVDGSQEGDTHGGWNEYYPGSLCKVTGGDTFWTATNAQWYDYCSRPGAKCRTFSRCTAPPSGECVNNAGVLSGTLPVDRELDVLTGTTVSASPLMLDEPTSGSSTARTVTYTFSFPTIVLPADDSEDEYLDILEDDIEVEFNFYYRGSSTANSDDFDNSSDVVVVNFATISDLSHTVTVPTIIKNNKDGSRPVIEPDETIIVSPRVILSKQGSSHVYERLVLSDITLTIEDKFDNARYLLVSNEAVDSEGVIVRINRNYVTTDDKTYTIESGNPDLLNLYQYTAGATDDDFGTVRRESSTTKTLAPPDTEIQFRAVYVGPNNGSVTRADLRVLEGSTVLETLTIPLDTTP